MAIEANDGALALKSLEAEVAAFRGEMRHDAASSVEQAETLWEMAGHQRGAQRLQGQLDAIRCWLERDGMSPLLEAKWQDRIEQVKSGGMIKLGAKDARLLGDELTYNPQTDTILGWHNPTHYIERTIHLSPGQYRLEIEYSGEGPGPESLFAVQILLQNAKKPIWQNTLVLGSTGSWNNYGSPQIGSATIRFENDYCIRFGVARPRRPNRMGLAIVKSLRLLPANDYRFHVIRNVRAEKVVL